jgi:hypothetical protein
MLPSGCRRMCADFPLAAVDTLLCVLWHLDIIDCDFLSETKSLRLIHGTEAQNRVQ